ncbi:MAG: tetratricopeptide repeat protein [Elusimicrobia bacterium]|nr:tetratricopeptide repeat protein [Elusimicrobiota bacterium]
MPATALSRITTRSILWGLPLVYFAVVVTFYLRTYDSAQVKITVAQMGITALLGLWLMEKLEERRLSLSAEYLPVYAPFAALLLSGAFSYLVVSHFKLWNIDDMVRRLLYMSAALIVFDKIRSLDAVERILKFLLLALFVSTFYGFIQFLDSRFFPPNSASMPVFGLDIFIWRQAFQKRIFSTFGNPNFFGDYIVIMTPIVLSWALAKKSFAAWCLLALAWFNVAFTETKGAWMGVGIVTSLWVVLYSLCIPLPFVEYLRKKIRSVIIVTAAGALTLLMLTPGLNPFSIPFRIYTWLSTWEIISGSPVAGIGIGNFRLAYSAYRRPTIFHIEAKHNTETDHAENEHIEVLMDEGILGFGVYVWLIFMVSLLSYRALQRWRRDGRVDVRAYHLLGVWSGWLGTMIHNNFDVSIRFVSSGVFTGLLPAMAVALALSDRTWREAAVAPVRAIMETSPVMSVLRRLFQGAAALVVAVVSYKIFVEFFDIQQRMLGSTHPGDQLMVFLAWAFFIMFMGLSAYSYFHSIWNAKSILACLAAPLLAFPIYFFWGWFRGDVHHNVAIVHSKGRQWDDAIKHYQQVIKRNPGFVMSYYFLGNVFNDRWDMEPKNRADWGDPPGVMRRDFDRAIEVYERIRNTLAPNYVQMHYHVGNLFLKRAEWGIQNNEPPEKIREFYEESVRRYRLYQHLDPVFPDNYYRMGYVLTRLGRFEDARQEFKKRILAFRCADLTGNGPFASLINQSHWTSHAHPDPEAYLNLSKSYLMSGDYRKAVATHIGYLRQIDPNNQQIQGELGVLMHNRDAILQKIRQMAPVSSPGVGYGVEKSVIGK